MEVKYLFKFDEDNGFSFKVDPLRKKEKNKTPDWVDLDYCKCENCPLKKEEYPDCPIAEDFYLLIEKIKDKISFTCAKVTVQTKHRVYYKKTDLQSGVFSLMGLIMATSACPHFKFLRPLAKYHLPFSSIEETLFRSSSLYLLEQHMNELKGKEYSYSLDGLRERYNKLEIVNKGLAKRIRKVSTGDAGRNAIVALNVFAQMFESQFENDFSILAESFFKND